HSPPNEHTGHVPRFPPRDLAAAFLEDIQAKVGPCDHGPARSPCCVQAATWQLMMVAQEATPAAARSSSPAVSSRPSRKSAAAESPWHAPMPRMIATQSTLRRCRKRRLAGVAPNEARARNEDRWHDSPAQILPQATPRWYYGPI